MCHQSSCHWKWIKLKQWNIGAQEINNWRRRFQSSLHFYSARTIKIQARARIAKAGIRCWKRGLGTIFDFEIRTEWTAVIPAPDLGGLGFMVATFSGKILEDGFDLQLCINAIWKANLFQYYGVWLFFMGVRDTMTIVVFITCPGDWVNSQQRSNRSKKDSVIKWMN